MFEMIVLSLRTLAEPWKLGQRTERSVFFPFPKENGFLCPPASLKIAMKVLNDPGRILSTQPKAYMAHEDSDIGKAPRQTQFGRKMPQVRWEDFLFFPPLSVVPLTRFGLV